MESKIALLSNSFELDHVNFLSLSIVEGDIRIMTAINTYDVSCWHSISVEQNLKIRRAHGLGRVMLRISLDYAGLEEGVDLVNHGVRIHLPALQNYDSSGTLSAGYSWEDKIKHQELGVL